MQLQTEDGSTRRSHRLHEKLREYILGREQEDYDRNGHAKRLTPIEAFDEMLETDRAKAARARAPRKKPARL